MQVTSLNFWNFRYYFTTKDEPAAVIIWMAQAVNHVHKHGYFHRDMKPENLLLPFAKPRGGGGQE